MLLSLTFMVDPIINLIGKLHHECKKKERHSLCSKNTYVLLVTIHVFLEKKKQSYHVATKK